MRQALVPAGIATVLLVGLAGVPAHTQPAAANTSNPIVVLDTAKGVIEIETLPSESPKSVAHFTDLARRGFYRGQRFHWVQPGVVQAGDPLSRDMTKQKDWGTGGSGPKLLAKPLGIAEPAKRRFERGSVGLAYRPGWKPETADSQFFILTGANPALNGKYAMLGRVVTGMAVVDKIALHDVIKNVSVK